MLLALLPSSCGRGPAAPDDREPVDDLPMMVMRIRQCSRLYTAEYRVHKIVTHDDQLKLKGTFLQRDFDIALPMSSRKVAIPVDATLKAYVDLGGFSEDNVVREGGRIEIILPDPKVELTGSRIDHEEITRHVSLVRADFTDAELAEYESQGRAAILAGVPSSGLLDMAMENAAHALVPMLRQMGYAEEDITVTFRKRFTLGDLPALLDESIAGHGR